MHAPPDRDGRAGRGADPLSEAIVQTVPTPLVVLDDGLKVVLANPAFLRLFDLPAEEVIGCPLLELSRGPWDLSDLRPRLGELLDGQGELRDFELRADAGDGSSRVLLVNGHPLRHDGAGRTGILLAMENVTERHQLERRARVYARELERSNRELEDFAHAASHDLQEPLRKIRTYAERLPALLDPGSMTERAETYVTRLREAAERMQERIDDLLQLARVGRARPELVEIDLDDVLADVLEDLDAAIEETGAEIDVGPLGTMEADPLQMRLLFQNLISNALKFHEEGRRPVIRVKAEDGTEGAGSGVRTRTLLVEDRGIGFEQQYAERIFGPFQRLHGRAEYQGSGVGLSLCRRIVEHHSGSIRAEGTPGEGARFIITLPLEQSKETL